MVVLGVLATMYLIYASATGTQSGGEPREKPVTVEVVKGDTLSGVAGKLERKGVIENAFMFKVEARLDGRSTEIKPGEYTFEPGEDADGILAKLTAGKAAPVLAITVPEGLDLEQTARVVAQHSGVSAARFEKAARQTDYAYGFLEDPEIKTTQGFLFPKRYEFEGAITAEQMVIRMLEQYLLETQTLDISSAKKRLKVTEYELVTVASLVEKEAANPRERPLVASVIYNRLRRDMPLQIDATIQYALGHPEERLSLADLNVRSPYNTYVHTGLPPGPICSPGRQSLAAAANPARTDFLYYVLKAGGEEHFFTDDYDKFLKMKRKRDAYLAGKR